MTFYIYFSVKVLGLESYPCLNTTLCNIFAKINLKIVVQENYELIWYSLFLLQFRFIKRFYIFTNLFLFFSAILKAQKRLNTFLKCWIYENFCFKNLTFKSRLLNKCRKLFQRISRLLPVMFHGTKGRFYDFATFF